MLPTRKILKGSCIEILRPEQILTLQDLSDALQDGISDVMPEGVIHPLEVIQVEAEDGKLERGFARASSAFGFGNKILHEFIQRSQIRHPRQWIFHALVLHGSNLFVQRLVLLLNLAFFTGMARY